MNSKASGADGSKGKRPVVCGPVTARQAEVLKAARDNRGNLTQVPVHWIHAVASLVMADLLEIDAVGFRMTSAGGVLLAEIEELESADPGPSP